MSGGGGVYVVGGLLAAFIGSQVAIPHDRRGEGLLWTLQIDTEMAKLGFVIQRAIFSTIFFLPSVLHA